RIQARASIEGASSRASIYAGALSDNYVLAYSNSLMDNFIMDVQGSGYIDFGDGSRRTSRRHWRNAAGV
ncbi:hypothetical protein FK521_27815, partial [Klebsiella pneumoniae]|nr:hypothetical protein [Klebsiella pneumoniae]